MIHIIHSYPKRKQKIMVFSIWTNISAPILQLLDSINQQTEMKHIDIEENSMQMNHNSIERDTYRGQIGRIFIWK